MSRRSTPVSGCRGWEGPIPHLESLKAAPAEQGACVIDGGEERSTNHSLFAPSHPRGSVRLTGPRGYFRRLCPRLPEVQEVGVAYSLAGDSRRTVAGRGRQRHRPGRSEWGGASSKGGGAGAGPPIRFWKLLEVIAVLLMLLLPPQRVPPPAQAGATPFGEKMFLLPRVLLVLKI